MLVKGATDGGDTCIAKSTANIILTMQVFHEAVWPLHIYSVEPMNEKNGLCLFKDKSVRKIYCHTECIYVINAKIIEAFVLH